MEQYFANASVIYTDDQGNSYDTFVIFDTDAVTGITHINHENLKVKPNSLKLHAKTVGRYHLPIDDAFSFEIINKLREKYAEIDTKAKVVPVDRAKMHLLAKAS